MPGQGTLPSGWGGPSVNGVSMPYVAWENMSGCGKKKSLYKVLFRPTLITALLSVFMSPESLRKIERIQESELVR